jgi:hypothetical protein
MDISTRFAPWMERKLMTDYYWKVKATVSGGKKYDPSQPRVPAGDPRGGQWMESSGGGFFSSEQRPEPRKPTEFQTPRARVQFGIAGDSDAFRIDGPHGSRGSGYWRNVDFPGEYGKSDRGEIFFITAGSKKRAGLGTSIARDMLAVMKANGATTLNMYPTTSEGKFLIAKLIREGDVELIRTSSSGKAEYRILR